MKKRLLIVGAAIIIGFGAYLLITLVLPEPYIPQEFSEARLKGAELATKIVDLANNSLESISTIAKYDREGNRPEALTLISKEVLKNRTIQEEAIRLSSQLERMARSLQEIKPNRAKILATEAVSSEIALVSRLLSYNDYLLQLFKTLEAKFQNPSASSNGRVQELINKINEEARAINSFNRKFNQSLAEFDKMF